MKEYITIQAFSTAEYTEKHSRFIANAYPCESEAQAVKLLAELKSRYWDARHNVYAYVLHDGTARFSDDGEPHGTAGKPVLDVINGSGITDVLVCVTRYFGGILLGTGGLVRAYSTSTKDALQSAQLVQMCPCTEYEVVCDYSSHARLVTLIENCGGVINDTEFTDSIKITFVLKEEYCPDFEDKVREAFSSRIVPKTIKKALFPYKI